MFQSLNPKSGQKQSLYQLLSIDILLGVMAVGLFATRILNVSTNPVWWVILPLATWTVYTLDHLIDGYARKGKSEIYRHRFHYNNRKVLILAILILGCIAIALSLVYLEKQIILGGLMLSGIVILYFILVHFQKKLRIKYIHKEAFIAIIYTMGILLAPFIWFEKPLQFQHFLLFGIFCILVWAESVAISFFDYDEDKADRLNSFAIVYGLKKTRTILIFTHTILVGLLFLTVLVCKNKVMMGAVIIESIMNFVLLGLIYFPEAFADKNRFRWIGETVFILPAFLIFF